MQVLLPAMTTGLTPQARNGQGATDRELPVGIDDFVGLVAGASASQRIGEGVFLQLPDSDAVRVPSEDGARRPDDEPLLELPLLVDLPGDGAPLDSATEFMTDEAGMVQNDTAREVSVAGDTGPLPPPPMVTEETRAELPVTRNAVEMPRSENDAAPDRAEVTAPKRPAEQPTDVKFENTERVIWNGDVAGRPVGAKTPADPLEAVAAVDSTPRVVAEGEGPLRGEMPGNMPVAPIGTREINPEPAAIPAIAKSRMSPATASASPTQSAPPSETVPNAPKAVDGVFSEPASRPAFSRIVPALAGEVVAQPVGSAPNSGMVERRGADPVPRMVAGSVRDQVAHGEAESRDRPMPSAVMSGTISQPTAAHASLQGVPFAVPTQPPPFAQPALPQEIAETGDPVPNGTLSAIEDGPKALGVERARAELPVVRSVTHQILQSVSRSQGEGVIEVRLQPEELGRVRVTMVAAEAGFNIQVTAERAETLDLIRRHIDLFESDLKKQGFVGMSFSFGSEDAERSDRRARDESPDDAVPERAVSDMNLVAVVGPSPIHQNGKLDIRI